VSDEVTDILYPKKESLETIVPLPNLEFDEDAKLLTD
jgi:hypothetical protein